MATPKRIAITNAIRLLAEAAMAMRDLNVAAAQDFLDMNPGKFQALRAKKRLASGQLTMEAAPLFGMSPRDTLRLYCQLVALSVDRDDQAETLADYPGIFFALERAIVAKIGAAKLSANLAKGAMAKRYRVARPPEPVAPVAAPTAPGEVIQIPEMRPRDWVARKLQLPEEAARPAKALAPLLDALITEEIATAEQLEARVERLAGRLMPAKAG